MTRGELALAHHRFYCVFGEKDCTEIDESDWDFADFALELFEVQS